MCYNPAHALGASLAGVRASAAGAAVERRGSRPGGGFSRSAPYAVKNAVYLLPNTAQSTEDFEWLRTEVVALGGAGEHFRGVVDQRRRRAPDPRAFPQGECRRLRPTDKDIKAMRTKFATAQATTETGCARFVRSASGTSSFGAAISFLRPEAQRQRRRSSAWMPAVVGRRRRQPRRPDAASTSAITSTEPGSRAPGRASIGSRRPG